MKRVINFIKLRYIMFVVSAVVIVAGLIGTNLAGGYNLGIDFQAGLNLRIQIVPPAMSVDYTGEGQATFFTDSDGAELEIVSGGEVTKYTYRYTQYPTLGNLEESLEEVEGLQVDLEVGESASTYRLIGMNYPVQVSEETAVVTLQLAEGEPLNAPIGAVRDALSPIETYQIQTVGNEQNQEYLIRVEDPTGDPGFTEKKSSEIVGLLQNAFPDSQVVTKQSDYVGPRFSEDLSQQAFTLTGFALVLILLYIWFRFRLVYAVSAIITLVHDVLIMLGFIGYMQIEVSTATIAAVLTIIGYSLNDTIVIFDRVRENEQLLRDEKLNTIINTSITQSMGRTVITSLTTLVAVLAIYIFATGSIQDFALNLIVGVIVGTYSSIFVASPMLYIMIRSSSKEGARKAEAEAPKLRPASAGAAPQVEDRTDAGKAAEKSGEDKAKKTGSSKKPESAKKEPPAKPAQPKKVKGKSKKTRAQRKKKK
ncbi:MAG: protein translocase subunit SecF [Spirochaetales bacterium]|nr:protein translocase subunit SecF [Spirochaetales bacterium]MCF7938116.1 protein translocase subunit SecF [Spirochaetales bacterium]